MKLAYDEVDQKDNSVKFLQLVEHPGGPDGGQFPQYHGLGLSEDGSAFYATADPTDPSCSFGDTQVEDLLLFETKLEALEFLVHQRDRLSAAVARLDELVMGFTAATEYKVYFQDREVEKDDLEATVYDFGGGEDEDEDEDD